MKDAAFAEYYSARGAAMRATAYLLCGDWQAAEDLTQTAFLKLYRVWERVERHDALDQYVRRVLLHAYLDERRRPWRRERSSDAVADAPVVGPAVEDRLVLHAALASLSAKQRAVIVLRFWEDLPVDRVADLLGMPVGTVKSQTARGLQALRRVLGNDIKDGVAR